MTNKINLMTDKQDKPVDEQDTANTKLNTTDDKQEKPDDKTG